MENIILNVGKNVSCELVSNYVDNLLFQEFSQGLTYTSVTRARTLLNISWDPFPDFRRLLMSNCSI